MNDITITNIFAGIESGLTNKDILSSISGSISPRTIDTFRELFCQDNFSHIVRKLHVTYIDNTVVGLEYVYSHHSANSICRIADYSRVYKKIFFNNYHGESVIVFDNFNSDIPVDTFINYFRNGYPLSLPARGYNRTACFTDVYILSDHCPSSLYRLPHLNPSPDAELLMHHIDTYLSYDPFTNTMEERICRL